MGHSVDAVEAAAAGHRSYQEEEAWLRVAESVCGDAGWFVLPL